MEDLANAICWEWMRASEVSYENKHNPSYYFTISKAFRVQVKRFSMDASVYTVQFCQFDKVCSLTCLIYDVLLEVIQRVLEHVVDFDNKLLGLEIMHESLDRNIIVPFTMPRSMTVEKILMVIDQVSQSK